MKGAFQTSREIFENSIWQDVPKFRIFFYIVGNAVFAEGGTTVAGIHLKRGQYLRAYRNLATDLEYIENRSVKRYSLSVISRKIEQLVKEERIKIEDTELGTLFTVLNYAMYQGFDHYKKGTWDSVGTGMEQGWNNNKNVKKDKNVKKERLKDICPESLTVIQDESIDIIPILETVKYGPDNTYYKMSIYFKTVVDEMAHKEGLEHLTKNANLQTWSDDFRKLVELDKQKDTQLIKSVMDWVVKDSFWKGNVLSAATFRKQFPKLVIAMNKGSKPKTGTSGKEIIPIATDLVEPVGPTDEEYQAMLKEAAEMEASKGGQRA